ncbi:DUF4124 domain-containing protein [Thiolapillus sp.]
MKRYATFLLLLFVATAQAEIYKWVDSAGNVHYGDQPDAANAKKMNKLPGLSTYAPPAVPEKPTREMETDEMETTPAEAAAKKFTYREISIVTPEEGGAVRSSPGTVSVFVALAPVLRKGDYLKAILDGKVLKKKYQSTVLKLKNVSRGKHKVAVAVYDENGKKLMQSKSVTFQLHRTKAKKSDSKPDPDPDPDANPKSDFDPDFDPDTKPDFGPSPPPNFKPDFNPNFAPTPTPPS